jgi:predicted nucleic acid-binding protein
MRNMTPIVWWATPVEIASGIARVQRGGSLKPKAISAAFVRLDSLRAVWREVPPSEHLRDLAAMMLSQFPLRSADSLQLAAALVWCKERPSRHAFVCADVRLSDAASKAGFAVERL